MKEANVLLGPSPVVTMTSTSPATLLAAVLQVIVVGLNTETFVAGTPPNVTDVAPVKPTPVILTLVPPALVPNAGKIAEIQGE